jgi:hypothetical protein
MMDMRVIRRSKSAYAAPVVIVKKPDQTNRICIDFRKLNKVTVVDPEPMVSIPDVLEKMAGDFYFSTIDLSKGYWQIPVAEKDIHKTSFVTPDRQYEFLKMPFGMVNAGATLVRAMREVLKDMECVHSYIDDIIVHTKTWEQHIQVLSELFLRLTKSGFTIRPTKCKLGEIEVEFIGHKLSYGKATPIENNIEKIRQAKRPETKTQVKSFLGLTGFYREYMPSYSTIAAPLTDLTRKGQPQKVIWNDAAEKAYRVLKAMITRKPVLRLPDQRKEFYLRTDASDVGVGATLMQEDEGKLYPVSYASRKLNDRERKYSTMERECLGIVWAVKKFDLYLFGRKFTLQTDHQPLTYLDRSKYLNSRIMRWAMFLQSYNMKIQAIKGKDNHGADFLSRVC